MTTNNSRYEQFEAVEERGSYSNRPVKFTLRDAHLKLLAAAYVNWQDCESGAPEIDPKRPYGDSSVAQDVAEILGIELPDYDKDYAAWNTVVAEMLMLHRETTVALQIVLSNLPEHVTPGVYVTEAYSKEWRRLQ